ncbi:MAG: YbbC/YhhH family protein [candidate division Zixibacteria bacterium]|nr:YbbC/YhhH family protein [candidate division Zixibacteria bacterium]
MKSKIFFLALLFLLITISTTCSTKKGKTFDTSEENSSVIPVDGRVPNEETAIRIAEAVWLPIYGNEIYNSKPFHAKLIGDSIWVVEGTLPEGHLGGVPYAAIQKKDGKVVKISHGQ